MVLSPTDIATARIGRSDQGTESSPPVGSSGSRPALALAREIAVGWVPCALWLAVVVPCTLYICLQFAGLVLHIIAAAHNGPEHMRSTDASGNLASVCSIYAWLVLMVGLVRLVVKLRALAAAHSQRRLARKQ